MKHADLKRLQESVCGETAWNSLGQYETLTRAFLGFLRSARPTRIVSPTALNYVFYQYDRQHGHRITRPLNTELFVEDEQRFRKTLQQAHDLLEIVKKAKRNSVAALRKYKLDPHALDRAVYTVQQSLGSVGDSLANANQARKRAGMLFENLVRLLIKETGVSCEPRTIKVPLPGYRGRFMSYDLDLVFSRGQAIIASETELLAPGEIVGSVKTTSKDRLDKIFLDKFLLSRLLGRAVRVVAVFLHDVQRAKKQGNIFGVNSTFKSGHFLGYTIALNPLDGVYYVDPRPIMASDRALAQQIGSFSRLITCDLWRF